MMMSSPFLSPPSLGISCIIFSQWCVFTYLLVHLLAALSLLLIVCISQRTHRDKVCVISEYNLVFQKYWLTVVFYWEGFYLNAGEPGNESWYHKVSITPHRFSPQSKFECFLRKKEVFISVFLVKKTHLFFLERHSLSLLLQPPPTSTLQTHTLALYVRLSWSPFDIEHT